MLIFLYGKDNFSSQKRMKEMAAKFKAERDPKGMNLVVLDCEKSVENVLNEILATPFLSERRMIVLKNFLSGKVNDAQGTLLEWVKEKKIPEANIVLFWEGTDTFKTKNAKALFDKLSKEKYAQKFDELKGVKLGNWIANEIKERGGKITSEAVQFLVQHSGSDMWQINYLLDQLISYAPESEISAGDIRLFLDEKIDDSIFNLVDAIVGKQEKNVYKMIQEQYRKGEDVQYIFSMILRQFRILLELRDLFDRQDKISSDQLAGKLGLHPFVVKKSLPLIRQYNMNELKEAYNRLANLDKEIKTGYADQKLLLDMFVAKSCV